MIEPRRAPTGVPRIGRGGAVVLGVLILLVLAVAIVAGLVAVRQLGEGAAESKRLFELQERLNVLVRTQLAQETALRGYVITKDRQFLEPGLSGPDPFEEQAAEFGQGLLAADLGTARPNLDRVVAVHQEWQREIADPLINNPTEQAMTRRDSYGKVLTDRLRDETEGIRALINAKYDASEASLASNIDGTVEYAIAFVLLFALAGFYLTILQRNTVAELERQHTITASLQAALGVGWHPIPGSTIGSAYVSATREADVGGDLVDAWRIDDERGAVLIADMSGKGIDAVLNTAFCKFSIRAFADAHDDPAVVMTEFNGLFTRTVSDPSMFAVAFFGIVNARERTFQYVSAGHEPAFLRRGNDVRQLDVGGPIVGLLEDSTYRSSTYRLERGDLVVLATDGLTEARTPSGELLTVDGAVALIGSAPAEPQPLCDALIAAVRERSGGRIADDLALLALCFDTLEAAGGQPQIVAEAG